MRPIFLISHAGGSSLAYRTWPRELPEHGFSLVPLEFPGHGRRSNESLLRDVPTLVSDLISQMGSAVYEGEFMVFGHSLGGLLAYEVAIALQAFGLPPARGLIISGANPPHRLKLKAQHQLDDENFLAYVKKYGGVDERFMTDQAAMAFFTDVLRADYQALECHDWRHRGKVCAPVSVVCADDDPAVHRPYLDEWSQYTERNASITSIGTGGHLYLSTRRDQILEVLRTASLNG